MRRIAILGATGSIGASALDVIARHPDRFQVGVLAAHRNVSALAELCQRFRPELAVIADPSLESVLRDALSGFPTRVAAGALTLSQAACMTNCDTVLAAIVGAAGLESTLTAAQTGKRLLLANKEAVVMAGPLLLEALRNGTGELIPVDSEHNAIYQCLSGGEIGRARAGVRRIVLTASGGPFRGKRREDLGNITPEQACAHPKWSMGRKISVDSATLMNKGLEVIEAHWLFGVAPEQIEVVVHPQSIVHSLVEYADGSTLAQMGNPDMRTALASALAWPERIEAGVAPLDLLTTNLTFEAPDTQLFHCLPLAYHALSVGGTAPTILNAANEVAVAAFLERQLPFLAIPEVISTVLDSVPCNPIDTIDAVLYADLTARQAARRMISRCSSL